jgi:DNA-binding IclR family transcriptional regulator
MSEPERARAFTLLAERRGADWPAIRARIDASLAELRRLGFCVVEREFRPENAFAAVALRDRRADRVFSLSGGVIGDSAAQAHDLLYTRVGPRLVELAAVVREELGA